MQILSRNWLFILLLVITILVLNYFLWVNSGIYGIDFMLSIPFIVVMGLVIFSNLGYKNNIASQIFFVGAIILAILISLIGWFWATWAGLVCIDSGQKCIDRIEAVTDPFKYFYLGLLLFILFRFKNRALWMSLVLIYFFFLWFGLPLIKQSKPTVSNPNFHEVDPFNRFQIINNN